MEGYIEIPADKVSEAVCAAYDLSRPVGMGMLHYRPGPLDSDTLDKIVNSKGGIYMDYVHGRQCKFSITEKDGRFFVKDKWCDHTDADLESLLDMIGVRA